MWKAKDKSYLIYMGSTISYASFMNMKFIEWPYKVTNMCKLLNPASFNFYNIYNEVQHLFNNIYICILTFSLVF